MEHAKWKNESAIMERREYNLVLMGHGSSLLFHYYIFIWVCGQAAGAVGGAVAIIEVMPVKYKHMLGGPSLKVDTNTGATAEGVLTFIMTLAVLFIIFKGPRSVIVKNWMLAMSTVSLVVAGTTYTGPSMNPANVSHLSLTCF